MVGCGKLDDIPFGEMWWFGPQDAREDECLESRMPCGSKPNGASIRNQEWMKLCRNCAVREGKLW